MRKIAFFDTKLYDKTWFDHFKTNYAFEIKYFENKLNEDTVTLAKGCDGVIAFVNDSLNEQVIKQLDYMGISIVAMRCAGYNNVDFKAAFDRVHVVRVPAYSPYAVAEHAMALLLTLNRKLHKAYNRTREFNFSLNGLTGFDLYEKTIGVIGTGKIGQVFIDICRGFGMKVVAYDPYPISNPHFEYVDFAQLCRVSDIISLHCPLTDQTHHLLNKESFKQMKDGVVIINTSRGALIESESLLEALKSHKVGAAGLDVYEEESEIFFEDFSNVIIQDDVLARLVSLPNVIVTSHQAFLTEEALMHIAEATLNNLKDYFEGKPLLNEVCYQCRKSNVCKKNHIKRCF